MTTNDVYLIGGGPTVSPNSGSTHQKGAMRMTSTYIVEGMTCGHCVAAVTDEVSAIEGVTQVDVDLATGAVTVASDRQVDRGDMRAAIEEAGYVLSQ